MKRDESKMEEGVVILSSENDYRVSGILESEIKPEGNLINRSIGKYESNSQPKGCPSHEEASCEEEYDRKKIPVFSGVMKYFPDALMEVAKVSYAGNNQHNPGEELHWAREKGGNDLDALSRHLIDAGKIDDDGMLHSAKIAWRALANLQREIENR